eukprot:c9694_g1_i1.p1 GENE.c9694_g1_i1~~c9694_g1_i1.p1  ORF type:complete len:194 (+),score=27.19 c9694_g1_i1:455-1036(+)
MSNYSCTNQPLENKFLLQKIKSQVNSQFFTPSSHTHTHPAHTSYTSPLLKDTNPACCLSEVFCSQILANHLQPTISLSRLTAILAQAPNLFLPPTKVIAMLKTWGFLTTRPSSELFSFSLPNIGPIIAMVLRGRKEALSFIRRKKFKDVLEKDLLKHKLKTSTLGSKFHMQDIVGAELVRLVKTPTGNLLQLI